MFERLRVANVRGIKDLAIDNLGRVNLIVGANNVGKTSLLEALALLHANQNGYELRQIVDARGYAETDATYGALASIFGPWGIEGFNSEFLIAGEHRERGWSIALGSPKGLPTNEESLDGRGYGSLRFGPSIAFTLGAAGEHLYLQYFTDARRGRANVTDRSADVTLDLVNPETPEDFTSGGFFGEAVYLPSTTPMRRQRLPSLITQLRRSGHFGRVLETLRSFAPELVDIAPAVDRGQVSVDVVMATEDGRQIAVPTGAVGLGMQRLWDILVSLHAVTSGVVLIDELESGVYYANLPKLWTMIRRQTEHGDTQVFATTHSHECIVAAVEAFADQADEFRLHRIERQGEETVAVTYGLDIALAALHAGTELR